jgi:hypothetical protein
MEENLCDLPLNELPNEIQAMIMDFMVRLSFHGYEDKKNTKWSSFKSFSLVCKKWREFALSLFKKVKSVSILDHLIIETANRLEDRYIPETLQYFWKTNLHTQITGQKIFEDKKEYWYVKRGFDPPLPTEGCPKITIFIVKGEEWNLGRILRFFTNAEDLVMLSRFSVPRDGLGIELNMQTVNLKVDDLGSDEDVIRFKLLLQRFNIKFECVKTFKTFEISRSRSSLYITDNTPFSYSDYSFLPKLESIYVETLENIQAIPTWKGKFPICTHLKTGKNLKSLKFSHMSMCTMYVHVCTNDFSGKRLFNPLPLIEDVVINYMEDSLKSLIIIFWVSIGKFCFL